MLLPVVVVFSTLYFLASLDWNKLSGNSRQPPSIPPVVITKITPSNEMQSFDTPEPTLTVELFQRCPSRCWNCCNYQSTGSIRIGFIGTTSLCDINITFTSDKVSNATIINVSTTQNHTGLSNNFNYDYPPPPYKYQVDTDYVLLLSANITPSNGTAHWPPRVENQIICFANTDDTGKIHDFYFDTEFIEPQCDLKLNLRTKRREGDDRNIGMYEYY
uniref:CUB domain-containing protein n=1 Tax=Panagrellus redivivus TaxID=6233 RepID=A0A7E5A1V3_PANRE